MDWFPAASVATQVTVLVPIEKAAPDAGVQTTLIAPGQLSLTVGVKVTTALGLPGSFVTVRFAGQESSGGWVSTTATVKAQVLVFPAASVATQETTFVPFGNTEPGGGVQTK